jgi:hypothetical protein
VNGGDLLIKLQDELKELNLEIEKFNRRVKIMQKSARKYSNVINLSRITLH